MRLTAQHLARLGSSNRQSTIGNRQSAFTLVELLVSMALIIFTMTIMTQAFSTGMEAFRRLKAVGDMQQAMRTAVNALRQDLGSSHFDGDRRLSKLGVNPRINQGEIPPPPPLAPPHGTPYNPMAAVNAFTIYDTDGDGEITFTDLNYQETSLTSPNINYFGGYINQGPNKIFDNNRNGPWNSTTGERHFIDPGDLLYLRASGGWANGLDNDNNGVVDDFFLSTSPNGWFCPELGYFTYLEGCWHRDFPSGQNEFTAALDIPYTSALIEGWDSNGNISFRDVNDVLAFTVRLSGNGPQDFFYGKVPQGSPLDLAGMPLTRHDLPGDGRYASQWAEVIYFLLPSYEQVDSSTSLPLIDPSTGGPRLRTTGNYNQLANGFYRIVRYNLYRRVLLLVPEAFNLAQTPTTAPQSVFLTQAQRTVTINAANRQAAEAQYYSQYDISASVTQTGANTFVFEFNSPADVQFPQRRFGAFWNDPRHFGDTFCWDFFSPTYPAGAFDPRRMSLQQQTPEAALRWGADVVLKDVLSFDVKVWDPSALPWTWPSGPYLQAPAGDFRDLGYAFATLPPGQPSLLAQYPTGVMSGSLEIRQTNERGSGRFGAPVPNGPPGLLRGTQFGGAGFNIYTCTDPGGLWRSASGTFPYLAPYTMGSRAPYRFVYDTWTARNAGVGATPAAANTFNYADGAGNHAIPYPYPIRALQIKIRVWDERTKQARETTFVQNM